MENLDTEHFQYADEQPSPLVEYIWKKKKAVQNNKAKECIATKEEEKSSTKFDEIEQTTSDRNWTGSFPISWMQPATVASNQAANSYVYTDIPDVSDNNSEISDLVSSLSPKAPLGRTESVSTDISSTFHSDSRSNGFSSEKEVLISKEEYHSSEGTSTGNQSSFDSSDTNFGLIFENESNQNKNYKHNNSYSFNSTDNRDIEGNDNLSDMNNDKVFYDISLNEELLLCVVIKESSSEQKNSVLINDVTDTLVEGQDSEINITLVNENKTPDIITDNSEFKAVSISENNVSKESFHDNSTGTSSQLSRFISINESPHTLQQDLVYNYRTESVDLPVKDNLNLNYLTKNYNFENNSSPVDKNISLNPETPNATSTPTKIPDLSIFSNNNDSVYYEYKDNNLYQNNGNLIKPCDESDYFISVENLLDHSPSQTLTVKDIEEYSDGNTTENSSVKLLDLSNFVEMNFSFLKDNLSDVSTSSEEKEKFDKDVAVQTTITLLETIAIVDSDVNKTFVGDGEKEKCTIADDQNCENNTSNSNLEPENSEELNKNELPVVIPDMLQNLEKSGDFSSQQIKDKSLEDGCEINVDPFLSAQNLYLPATHSMTTDTKEMMNDSDAKETYEQFEIINRMMNSVTNSEQYNEKNCIKVDRCKPDVISELNKVNDTVIRSSVEINENEDDNIISSDNHNFRIEVNTVMNNHSEISINFENNETVKSELETFGEEDSTSSSSLNIDDVMNNAKSTSKYECLEDSTFSSITFSEVSEDTEDYYDVEDVSDNKQMVETSREDLRAVVQEEVFSGMMEECAWGEFQNKAVEVLSMFRRKLLPGVTSATDWIGYCENEADKEDSLDVIEEENEMHSDSDFVIESFDESDEKQSSLCNSESDSLRNGNEDELQPKIKLEEIVYDEESTSFNESNSDILESNLNDVKTVKIKYQELLSKEVLFTNNRNDGINVEVRMEELKGQNIIGDGTYKSSVMDFVMISGVENENCKYENDGTLRGTENDMNERKRVTSVDDEVRSEEETGVEPSRPWRRRKEHLASDWSLVSTCAAEQAHCGPAEMVFSVELECGLEEGLRSPDSVLLTSGTLCSELPSALSDVPFGLNCHNENDKPNDCDLINSLNDDEDKACINDIPCDDTEISINKSDKYKFKIDNSICYSDEKSNLNFVSEINTNISDNINVKYFNENFNSHSNNILGTKPVCDCDNNNYNNENHLKSDTNKNCILFIQNNTIEDEENFKCSVELKCFENKQNLALKLTKDVSVQEDVSSVTGFLKEDESGRGLQVGSKEEDVTLRGTSGDATSLDDTSWNSPSGIELSDSIECVAIERGPVNNCAGILDVKCNKEDINKPSYVSKNNYINHNISLDGSQSGCDDKNFDRVDKFIDEKYRYCYKSEELIPNDFIVSTAPETTEDEMRQKKKNEVETSEDAAVDTSGDCCNGYHRGTLKSALKRNTKSKSSKKKHRVQFDESLNKFFDADYVILIREDPEDGEGVCECGEELCYDCAEDQELGLPEEVQSPRFDLCAAFEPPMEFVDQVTLSPPDGYKDISQSCCPHHFHQRRQRTDDREEWEDASPVTQLDAKESKNEEEEAKPSGSGAVLETGNDKLLPANEQPSPSTPTNALHHQQLQHHQQSLQQSQIQPQQQRYIVETITMTTVTERRIVREADDQVQRKGESGLEGDGKLSGILKGGKLWKSTDSDESQNRQPEQQWSTPEDPDGRRSVRFCDGQTDTEDLPAVPPTELTLTFKLGNHVMVSNNSRPNSAVRQLFPAPRFMSPPPQSTRSPDSEDPVKTDSKYLVTTENLRLFDESKKSKLKQYFQPGSTKNKDGSSQTVTSPQQESQSFAPASDDEDSLQNNLIKRTIERNTLRRSLLRYPHDPARLKRNQNKMKTENSLVERIKQLTCDVEEEQLTSGDEKPSEDCSPSNMPPRTSPPGEESKPLLLKTEKLTSSGGMSSTYKKLTDLFSRRSDKLESHPHNSMALQTPASIEHQYPYYQPVYQQATSPPDLGNGLNTHNLTGKNNLIARTNSTTEARKQFLSTLAPLTACVSGSGEDSPVNKENPGDRGSVASASTSTAAETEYSLDDIEEALVDEPGKTAPQPDVVAGTPAGDTQDELALFVQQDASRIERLRKRYSSTPTASTAASEDDEQDDYGFNRRPSVRGIKPRFGSTTEILQQMQSQLQPPPPPGSHVSWPYYSPDIDPRMGRTSGTRTQMPVLKEDGGFAYVQAESPIPEYPSGSPVDGGARYQHLLYSSTGNLHQPMRIGGGGTIHHVHSESPPPGMMVPLQEVPGQMYARRALPGGSLVQMQVPVPVRLPHYPDDTHYPATSIIRVGQGQQQTIRVPYPSGTPVQVHLLATRRGDSPQRPPHLVVARGTQTSSISTTYYQLPPPPPRTSYPLSIRGPLLYSANHDKPPHLAPYSLARSSSPTLIPSLTSSPTRMKPHAAERGVPEGAASSSPAFPQDSVYSVQVSTSTNIPSPQDMDITNRVQGSNNSTQQTNNPVFYAMNV